MSRSATTPLPEPSTHRPLLWRTACTAICLGAALAAEVDLTPIPGGDGSYTQVTVAGQTAWQNSGTSAYLYGRRPDSFPRTAGQTLYVRVTYFDDAAGIVDLQYDSQTNAYTTSPLHTRTSRVGSGLFVNGYFELPNVLFNKRQNGSSDFRVICGTSTGAKVPVRRITLSDTPFADPDFQLAVARAWQNRYTGPAKDYVDTSTLKGKVMTGYQGWFGTPNDIADTGGWKHWARNGAMIPENFTMDAWPDLTEYDPASLARAENVMTASGAPAYLFSSRNYSAVQKHFRWMRKHNIDGAWLQRFNPKAGAESEWVLRNVSQAAAEEGLVWGVEYDVSGMADATVAAKLMADWVWLTTQFDILNDPRYIHEDGKPVVFIWGLAVPDRNFTTASANAAVDWFKAQGAYVIGGLPTNWNTLDAGWQTHMAKYDGVLVWMNTTPSDATFFRNRGQDFYPHVWPGFSWAHLKMLPATPLTQYTDRTGGQFFWTKGRDWINAGATDSLFFGMWDEYDEATHTMPMTDDPPPPYTQWGRFINNQGKPADWWMMLADELKRMMLEQRANTNTLPTVSSLANRSNIGAEASVDLGTTDLAASLSRVQQADGNTTVETVGGKVCRGNTTPATDRYLYFNVTNTFAFQLVNGDVTIEVEYYDNTDSTVLGLQYDGAGANYTTHPQNLTTTGSNTWRRVRFEIADAYFGGRQNGSSDFRLTFSGKKLNVNRVWVRLPEGKAFPFTWTNATAGPALNWSQNANWLGGIVGQSDPTSIVRFFPNQTMPGGTIPISNNLTGQQFGTLQLGGTASSSADTTVTLGGNALSLGGTAPTITNDATKTSFNLTYDIAAPVTLLETTQVSGNGDASLRISGLMSGTGGLTKTGLGTLTLTAANTYTGTTTITTGTLKVGDGANGRLGTGNVVNNAALEFNTSGNNTYTNIFSGSGTLAHNGSGTTTLNGIPAYSGITTVNAGTLEFVDAAVTPNRSYGAIATGAALEFDAATADQNAGSLVLTGQGTFRKTGNFTCAVDSGSSTVAMGSGALVHIAQGIFDFGAGTPGNWSANLADLLVDTGDTFDGSATAVVIDELNGAGTVKIAGNATDGFGLKLGVDGGSGSFSGVISNSTPDGNQFSLVKTGAGTQILSGANTFTGDTNVTSGTLALSGSGSLANTASIIVGSGATLDVSAPATALTLGSGQTLKASGTGATPTGTIRVATGKNLSLGNATLGLEFTAFGGGATAPLTLAGTGGSLNLNGRPIKVTTTSLLSGGPYKLVAKSGSATVTGTPGPLIAAGSGFALFGTLSVIDGELFLTLAPPPTYTITNTTTDVNGICTPTGIVTVAGGGSQTYTLTPNANHAVATLTVNGAPVTPALSYTFSNVSADQTISATFVSTTTLYWDSDSTNPGFGGTTGTWGTTSFWSADASGSSAPLPITTAPNSSVNFGSATLNYNNAAVSVAVGGVNAGNITFGAGQSTALTLSGGAITLGDTAVITVDNAANTIASVLTGAGTSLTKAGTGILTLSATNTYTGDTAIAAGTLRLGANNVLPDGPGKGNVALTGTLDLNTFSETLNGLSGVGIVDTLAGGTPTLTLGGNNATSTFSGTVTNTTGTLSLTKTGTGTLTLAGANSYGGLTTISDGILALSGAGTLGGTSSGLTLSGGQLDLGGFSRTQGAVSITAAAASGDTIANGTLTASSYSASNTTGNAIISALLTGPGGFTKTGGGTVTLSAANSYAGKTTISGGTLQFAKTASLYNGATGDWTAANIAVASTLALNVGGSNEFTTANVTTLLNNLGGANGTTTTGFASGARIGFDTTNAAAGTFTVADNIANSSGTGGGAIGVTKLGTGILLLTNATNGYTGSTAISGGTLRLSGSGRLNSGTYAGAISIASGATLDHAGGAQTLSGAITGGGTLIRSSGTDLILTNSGNSYGALIISNSSGRVFINSNVGALPSAATVNITSGNLVFGASATRANAITVSSGGSLTARSATTLSNVTLPGSGSVVFNNDDSNTNLLTISNDQTLTGALTVQIGGSRMLAGTTALGGVTLAGNLTGGGGLVVASSGNLANNSTLFGTGVLTLSGTNDYLGGTTVQRGTLRINGNQSGATGVVTVGGATAGGTPTLAGTGTIGGNVTIAAAGGGAAGTLAPGSGYIGNLVLNSTTLTFGTGSTASFEVDADTIANRDQVTGIGALTYGGILKITATGTLAAGDSWDLFDFTSQSGTFDNNSSFGTDGSSDANLPDLGSGLVWQFNYATGTLSVATAVSNNYASWITGTSFTNGLVPLDKRGANDDPDNDGIPNLVEYAIALQDPTVPNPTIGSYTATSLSFTKRPGTSGLTYAIQESTDLGVTDAWAAVTGVPPVFVNDETTISHTFTPGIPEKNFLRLQVFSN